MSDAEVICRWMEPRPTKSIMDIVRDGEPSPGKWWMDKHPADSKWYPRTLDLDALHEVEERLTEEQRYRYAASLPTSKWWSWELVHASAEQKIKALAAVLREGGASNV